MEKEIIIDAVRRELETSRMDLGTPEDFPDVVEIASNALQDADADPVDTARLHTLAAMGLLGPKTGYPDDTQCEALEEQVELYCEAGDYEALLDLVAAFGCGWGNQQGIHDTGWDGLWSGAFTYLVKRVRGICWFVQESLSDKLHVQFPSGGNLKDLVEDAATTVTTMLVQPVAPQAMRKTFTISAGITEDDPIYAGLSVTIDEGKQRKIPTGSRAVYQCIEGEARDDSHGIAFKSGDIVRLVSSETVCNARILSSNMRTMKHEKRPTAGQQLEFVGNAVLETIACTCGRVDCRQLHRLSAWDPSNEFGKLQYFLLGALRGQMQDIKIKDFAQSLLGNFWARCGWPDGSRLRLAEVVHHACLREECINDPTDRGINVHMGDRCDRCSIPVGPRTPLVTRERLIVVNSARSAWEFREFWRCGIKNCRLPGLQNEGKTLIDADNTIKTNASKCAVCNEAFWPPDQYADVGRHFANAKTLLAGCRRLENSRQELRCHACGHQGQMANYCFVCELNNRTCELPARPSWYFIPTRFFEKLEETESEEDKLLEEEEERLRKIEESK